MMKLNGIYPEAGKMFFVLFDVLAILGLWNLIRANYRNHIIKLYAYNPLFIYLTVRGSCESISMALMYWCLYFIFGHNGNSGLDNRLSRYVQIKTQSHFKLILGYCLYGLWVHIRVYPIVFLPLLFLNEYRICQKTSTSFFNKFILMGVSSGAVFSILLGLFYTLYGVKFIE